MLSFFQVTDSVKEVLAAVSQEIIALALFAASFFVFKYLNARHGYCNKAQTARKTHKQVLLPSSVQKFPTRNQLGSSPAQQQRRAQEAEDKLLNLLESREFTAALNAYRVYEREGLDRSFTNEALYEAFIQSAVRVGKIDVVERMLRTMSRNRMTASVGFWHSTLKMLSSRKHYSTCLMLFASFSHMLPNDKVIFSCLINAALESGALEKAVPMLHRYRQCELEPADYITSFRVHAGMADADAAEELFLQIGAITTPLMLNLALLACINAKQPQRAMDLVLKAHKIETSTPEKQQIADTISYNTLIKGFVASSQTEQCMQCFESMQCHSLQPDDVTLTSLLEISFADKTGAVTDQLLHMLLKSGRTLDVGTCNLFIKGLIRAECLPKAMEIYDCLKNCSRTRPTVVTYSMLIKACTDTLNMEAALFLVEDMTSSGVAPDEIVFTTLLDGCRLVDNQELGERIFKDMIAAGVKPSDYTLTMLVKLYGRAGAHEKAHKLVEAFEADHKVRPSVIHYTCLMSGCLRNKSYGQAWAAYQLMEKHGIAPDEMLMTTLLPAMAASGAFDRVVHLARRALRRPGGIRVPASTLKNILAQMVRAPGAEKHAEEMKMLMQGLVTAATDSSATHTHRADSSATHRADRACPW